LPIDNLESGQLFLDLLTQYFEETRRKELWKMKQTRSAECRWTQKMPKDNPNMTERPIIFAPLVVKNNSIQTRPGLSQNQKIHLESLYRISNVKVAQFDS
jgi:hypothetical protein